MLQISNVYISNAQQLKSFKSVICRSLKTNLSVIRLPHNVTATSHTSTKCIQTISGHIIQYYTCAKSRHFPNLNFSMTHLNLSDPHLNLSDPTSFDSKSFLIPIFGHKTNLPLSFNSF